MVDGCRHSYRSVFAGLSVTELLPMHMRSGQVREVVGLSFEAVFGVSLNLARMKEK